MRHFITTDTSSSNFHHSFTKSLLLPPSGRGSALLLLITVNLLLRFIIFHFSCDFLFFSANSGIDEQQSEFISSPLPTITTASEVNSSGVFLSATVLIIQCVAVLTDGSPDHATIVMVVLILFVVVVAALGIGYWLYKRRR